MSARCAVITGGAGGIGAATAERLAAKGFAVLVVDRDLEAAEAVAQRLGQPSSACAADVSNEDDVKGYVAAAIERYGRIDAFFNNAGIEGAIASVEDYPTETFDQVLSVNLRGAFLGLKHVVITSVTRDDLADGGAEHFRQTVDAVRAATGATIEVLVPDFLGKEGALERLMEAKPDVFNHNTETVPRLYRTVRGRKSVYAWTLRLLADAKRLCPEVKTKSGLMLGLGETRDELLDVFADLVDHGVDYLTLGQYLQPTLDALPVERYVPPEEFVELGEIATSMGFRKVASGPLVRSSYHARDMAEDGRVA
jgi:hypothetical protein